ncbi:MAG TPA: NUDIX domain-containing protein [Candidatus Saccharimonadales bacterium]|nr:NUDIX domain-containing protein [Candidatus Saccharimonadales bacterium]
MTLRDLTRLVAGKAIIKRNGKILVLQQSQEEAVSNAGWYHMPGGIAEPGETIEQAVLREIKEETGLDAQVVRLLEAGEWEADIRGEHFQFVGLFYECTANRGDVMIDPAESAGYTWVGLEDLEGIQIVEPAKSVIRRALGGA